MSISGRFWSPSPSIRLPHVATTLAVSALLMLAPWLATGSGVTVTGLLSLAGTAGLALAARHLLRLLGVIDADRAAALIFALPTVALGAGLMGQCDTLGAVPIVMALAAAVQRRPVSTLVWFGLALGFDGQALLIAPFFLALLINRRTPMRLWPVAPLTAIAVMLPSWAVGQPLVDCAIPYLQRGDGRDALSFNAPNIWAIVQILPLGGVTLLGLACAAAIGASFAYVAHFSVQPLTDRKMISAALLSTLLTAGLLPGMHEGHFFLAGVLALVMALVARDRTSICIVMLVQIGSTLGIIGAISGIGALPLLGAIAMIAATVQLARPLLKSAANDNPLIARTV